MIGEKRTVPCKINPIMAKIIDNHIHIGRFDSVYYAAKTVFTVLQKAGVSECLYSSTTSGSSVNSERSAVRVYRKIRAEINDAQNIADRIGIRARPLYWVVPAIHGFMPELTLEQVMTEAPYTGFKLHPRANFWDLSDTSTQLLAESVFIYADKKKLPVLVHTGYDRDRADLFEDFFPLCKKGKIILAHCRPVETVLRLLAEYGNVFCDTAFTAPASIAQIRAAGFGSKILFGSDFPITDYFNNKRMNTGLQPTEENLYAEYLRNISEIVC